MTSWFIWMERRRKNTFPFFEFPVFFLPLFIQSPRFEKDNKPLQN